MNRKIVAVTLITVAAITGAVLAPTDAALAPAGAGEQDRRLGSISFPNSGASEAQGPFIQGVLLLHSFEFEDAATAFRGAQQIDSDFALAYWGEAMTYNHPLWRQQDGEAARAALARYAPTAEDRQAKAPTEREAAYLATLDVLYGEGDKSTRDLAYMGSMRRLSATYPEDLEARAFHALAILGSTDGERDFATYMKAAAVAQPIVEQNPQHPGAVHYIIHSFDDPVHAPLGVDAARAYSDIAPDAGHAQHMTSHIFVALGLWNDVVSANIRARDVQNARLAELGRPGNVCGHYTSWLHYGWLMRGDKADAERGMAECRSLITDGDPTPAEVGYFVNMRARHVLDSEDWDAADRLSASVDRPGYHFISGYAALKRGDRAQAENALRLIEAGGAETSPRLRIMQLELAALLAHDQGNDERALSLAADAAQIEEGLPFEFGPPASLKPPHELLGELALEAGRAETAMEAFRRALDFTPERAPSLEGFASSARALDLRGAAEDAETRLSAFRRSP